jgi:hypothetical protein
MKIDSATGRYKIDKTYVWNRGRKKRPSEYEELTQFYSTPAVPFLADQESHPAVSPLPWHYTATRIGPPDLERSRLKYEAWELFLDPDEMHYQKYVSTQWNKERSVNESARAAELLQLQPTAPWIDFMRGFFPPLRYSKWSRVQAFQYVIRFVPSSTVDACVAFQAFDQLRATQRIIRRSIELQEQFGGFDGHRAAWLDEPDWQPAREFAERINALRDWGEVIVATNLCLEALIEPLMEEVGRLAAANGDMVTSTVMASLLTDSARHRRWTDAFIGMLVESEPFGVSNRDVITEWLSVWYPRAVAVIRGIGPRLDAVAEGRYAAFEEDILNRQYPALLDRVGLAGAVEGVAVAS